MKFKTTWAIIALFGALGAYLYFVDEPRERAATAAKEKEGVLLPGFDPSRVTEILIEGKKGRIRLTKGTGDRWASVEPFKDSGDSERIRTLLEGIKALKSDREVAPAGGDGKPFGLDVPEATLQTAGQPATLMIGAANPFGNARYLRVNRGPIELVKSYSLEGLLVAPDDLRSKEIFPSFPWEKLLAVTVSNPRGTELKLAKSPRGRWHLDAPFAVEADPDAAEALVGKLHWGRIVSFAPGNAEYRGNLAKGLTIKLSAEGLAEPAVLRLAEADGAVRGQTAGRDALFTLGKGVLDAFRQTPADLRRMKPVLVKTWSAERVEISGDGRSARYEKGEGGAWRKEGRVVSGKEGDALQQMLRTLEEQKAGKVIDSPGPDARYGLDTPRVTVKLLDSQSGDQLLEIGEKEQTVCARAGKTGVVYVMGEDYLGRLLAVLKLSAAPVGAAGKP